MSSKLATTYKEHISQSVKTFSSTRVPYDLCNDRQVLFLKYTMGERTVTSAESAYLRRQWVCLELTGLRLLETMPARNDILFSVKPRSRYIPLKSSNERLKWGYYRFFLWCTSRVQEVHFQLRQRIVCWQLALGTNV